MITLLARRAFAAGLLATTAAAQAGATLEVAPVRHELTAARPLLSMKVSNRGSEPATLQLRAFVWSQADGEDRLLPADDAVISPPMFTLAPGASQIVRARVRPGAGEREASYRLLIDELPAGEPNSTVQVALRLSIPVFVNAAARAPAQLEWQLGAAGLQVVNAGRAHQRVHDLSLWAADGRVIAPLAATSPYLLAGAQRHWRLPERGVAAGDAVVLRYTTDHGRVDVPLVARP